MAAIVGMVLVLAFGLSAATAAEDEETLIRRGIALRKARDDVAARIEFQKAYDLGHSPRAAAQLGLAEFALGRWDEAEVHVSEGLRHPEDPWIKKYREELDQSLATIKAHVGRIEVIGDPPGAEVFVNGRLAGTLPLAHPVAVSEGQVDVELRARGFLRGTRTVNVSGGQYQRLVMRLDPEAGTSATAVVPPSTPSVEGGDSKMSFDGTPPPAGGDAQSHTARQGWRIAKWTSLGLASVSLATGITATVIHSSRTSTFEALHNRGCFDQGGQAVDVSGNPVAECQPSLNAVKTARTWQIVGFAAAGAFAATWLVLTLVEPRPVDSGGTRSAGANWACGLTLVSAGATCTMRF